MRSRHMKAFTLVELLVVVGIIALLISILLPSLARAREQSRSIKCLSNQREIGKQGATFANDHKGRLQLVAQEDAIDRADPSRNIYEYFDYPQETYSGALNSVKNRELLTWIVAYAETAGINLGKKNWAWGARIMSYDDLLLGNPADPAEGIEKRVVEWVTCPSDDQLLASPGFPDTETMASNTSVYSFDPKLLFPADDDSGFNDPARYYYGELSYVMNEDIVGSEQPGNNNTIIPGCYRSSGFGTGGSILEADGGIGNQNPGPGLRLRGDTDQVFQPSRTLLTIDGGDDIGPDFTGNQRVMLINTDSSESGADDVIKAHLGSFTWAHGQAPNNQVLPRRRHSNEGKLNVLKVDLSAEAVQPVRSIAVSGTATKVPVQFADTIWISPYDVNTGYDYTETWPTSGSDP